jgi:hypothetical protein
MDYNPEDTDVIHLLKKLKEANGAYPQELLASRRQNYLNQVAGISGAAGLTTVLHNAVKSGKSLGFPAAGKVVEALLVVALVAEAGAVSYFYRDKLAQVFRSITNSSKVEEIAKPPVISSSLPKLESTTSPFATEIGSATPSPFATGTGTPTPTDPSSPEVVAESTLPGVPDNTNDNTDVHTVSTPPANGNNGHHYGQTPKPERTKESGNTNINPNSQTNNSQTNNNQTNSNQNSNDHNNRNPNSRKTP